MDDPSTIGRYEIAERVGRGGMGVLYRGRDPVLDRDVAIKVMSADLSDDEDARGRFFKEAKAAARLQHRNIVTVYEFGEADGKSYIAMEFLRGQSLASRMRAKPDLTIDDSTDIVVQLCTGLHHAHSSGVVHRDVKPANVWVQPDGTVKLLDFGIARVAASTMTQGKDTLGSVAYMAPERFGNGPVDSRADIFAVGVVLYELLAGRRPFDGDSPTVIANKILHEAPPPLRSVAPGLPAALYSIVDRALQKDPEARYQTTGDLATDIQLARVENRTSDTALENPVQTALTGTIPADFDSRVPHRKSPASAARGLWPVWLQRVGVRGMVIAGIAIVASTVALGIALNGRRVSEDVIERKDDPLVVIEPVKPEPLPSTAAVQVESTPPGAAIMLNGSDLGKTTPAGLSLERNTPTRLRLTKAGFTPLEIALTEDHYAAGKVSVRLEPVSRDPVAISAAGPYPFEILEGSRVLSPAAETHEIRVNGRTTIRLRATDCLLDQAVTVDPTVRRQVSLQAPETGNLVLSLPTSLQQCQAFVGPKDLDYFPFAPTPLVPGNYKVRLECPDGQRRQVPVAIRSGETTRPRIQ